MEETLSSDEIRSTTCRLDLWIVIWSTEASDETCWHDTIAITLSSIPVLTPAISISFITDTSDLNVSARIIRD